MRVQRGPPLAVLHVGLAPRQIARLFAVDHAHLEAGGFQHPIERQPIHAGGFHGHGFDLALFEPVA